VFLKIISSPEMSIKYVDHAPSQYNCGTNFTQNVQPR